MKIPRQSGTYVNVVLLVLVGIFWVVLAPPQAGGVSSLVIINGSSMEPRFHRGDLAIVREAASYNVGDIVTYRYPSIGRVIHRIVARDGPRFVLQGDNNTFLDSYRPVQADIIGKLWIGIPGAGKLLEQLRLPRNMALAAGCLGVYMMGSVLSPAKDPRRSTHKTVPAIAGVQMSAAESRQVLVALLGVIATLAFLLGLLAFIRPTWRVAVDEITYQQSGRWSYSAPATAAVYDTAAATTGQPIFRRLSTVVDLRFAYHFVSDQPHTVDGTYRMLATVSNADGWKRQLELQPSTPFDGSTFEARGSLDLQRLQQMLDDVEHATGVHTEQYQIVVTPEVVAKGNLSGQAFEEQFAPALAFRLDALKLVPMNDATTGTLMVQPVKDGMVRGSHTEPNTFGFMRLDMRVSTARYLAMVWLGIALWGLQSLGVWKIRGKRHDETAMFSQRYASFLVRVVSHEPSPDDHVIDLTSFIDLAKIAQGGGHPILQVTDGMNVHYDVRVDRCVYRYRVPTERSVARTTGTDHASL